MVPRAELGEAMSTTQRQALEWLATLEGQAISIDIIRLHHKPDPEITVQRDGAGEVLWEHIDDQVVGFNMEARFL